MKEDSIVMPTSTKDERVSIRTRISDYILFVIVLRLAVFLRLDLNLVYDPATYLKYRAQRKACPEGQQEVERTHRRK